MNSYFDELCHLTFMHVHEQFMFFWWMFMKNFHERFMNNSSNFRRGRGGINPIIELTLIYDFNPGFDVWASSSWYVVGLDPPMSW